MKYDYVIVGGGPTGLTIALLLGKIEKKCLLIDDAVSLGGCNRVDRLEMNDYFTEHSCRIVTSAYRNFETILKLLGTKFEDVYVPYNFSISTIGGRAFKDLNKRDLLMFVIEFVKLIFNPKNGYNISVGEFMSKNKMTEETVDYIDRVCRLTDGAGKERYTLYAVLQLVNQQGLYKIYQPKYPNDRELFRLWEDALGETKNVTIIKNRRVETLKIEDDNNAFVVTDFKEVFETKNIVLCVSPKAIEKILNESNLRNAFKENFDVFVKENSYIEDVGITFHWKEKLDLPKIYGFPKTDWRVGFIINSDYTIDIDKYTKTLISAVILDLDKKSMVTNKTANETESAVELMKETLRQIRLSYPNLPAPNISIINPRVYRDASGWKSLDSSYFMSNSKSKFIDFQSKEKRNLFAAGTLNGHSEYVFTSIESAVSNGISFVNFVEPSNQMVIKRLTTVTDIIWMIIFVLIFIFLVKRII